MSVMVSRDASVPQGNIGTLKGSRKEAPLVKESDFTAFEAAVNARFGGAVAAYRRCTRGRHRTQFTELVLDRPVCKCSSGDGSGDRYKIYCYPDTGGVHCGGICRRRIWTCDVSQS